LAVAFWSTETLRQRISAENLIAPYNPQRVQHGAYELSVGHETFLTSDPSGTKKTLEDQVAIPPGQLALLITDEQVRVPADAISLISIKAGIKFRGLVNVSGFHVDPGFKGRLKFSVYNAGSQNIVLLRRQPAFLIWFCDLDRVTEDLYDGDHLDQLDINAEDVMRLQGEIASPGQLKKEIQDLQHSLTNVKYSLAVLGTLIVTILAAALRIIPLPDIFISGKQNTPAAQTSTTEAKPKEQNAAPIAEKPKESLAPPTKQSKKDEAGGK
jgi:dCTP deaminase